MFSCLASMSRDRTRQFVKKPVSGSLVAQHKSHPLAKYPVEHSLLAQMVLLMQPLVEKTGWWLQDLDFGAKGYLMVTNKIGLVETSPSCTDQCRTSFFQK